MNALTYKNIKTIIGTFAANHLQVANEHQGAIYQIDEIKNIKGFYLIWDIVANSPDSIGPGSNRGQIFTIDIMILDHVSEVNQSSNIDDVKNEAHLIAHDMLSVFQNYNKNDYEDMNVDLVLGSNWLINFTEERGSGLYAGVTLTVDLKSSFSYQRCLTPMTTSSSPDEIILSTTAESGIRSYPILMTGAYELPAITSNTPAYIMINRSGSDLELTTEDASTIEGEASVTVPDGSTFWVYPDSDNNNWLLI